MLRFLPDTGPQTRPVPNEPGTGQPAAGQPVAGRRAGAAAGGSRLVGRATLARLRGKSSALDEPTAPQPIITPSPPSSSSVGRVTLIYEQVRKPWRLWVFTAMLVSLTVGVLLGQAEAYRSTPPRVVPTVADVVQPSPVPLTASLGTVRQRRLEITGSATTLRIRTAQLGSSLYTITGFDPNVSPAVTEVGDGSVLTLGPGTGADVVLNSAVAWTIKLTGAANELDVDTRAGGLAGIESTATVARGLLQLAKPKGTVPMNLTGPIGDLTVRTEAGALVRVRAGQGAGQATIGGKTRQDVKSGTTLQESGWRATQSRYDIRLTVRANTILVERLPASG
ncbi:hypothetical protein [Actinoplanes sp. NPDC026670]|uniref:hypothetical protein n=1 Tax=Actinoplanes sp. NPDC026670 TaxID=3154700 RepID=UPI00340D4DE0